jgi:hypothetical protein
VLPAVDLKVPIGQTVQAAPRVSAVAPAFAKLPSGHVTVKLVQVEDPAEENEPAGQVPEHASLVNPPDVAAPYVPAGQLRHVVNT